MASGSGGNLCAFIVAAFAVALVVVRLQLGGSVSGSGGGGSGAGGSRTRYSGWEQVPTDTECAAPQLYTNDTCYQQCVDRAVRNSEPRVQQLAREQSQAGKNERPLLSCHSCPLWPSSESLYTILESKIDLSGTLLDAGTGENSLRWLTEANTLANWTAVTASSDMFDKCLGSLTNWGHKDRRENVVFGNWADPNLLRGSFYDVVLADYLVGAMDAFAPYSQDEIFARLAAHLKPDGVLVVIGWEPQALRLHEDSSSAAALVHEVSRLRDSCIKAAPDGYPYREFPLSWVERQLSRAGLDVFYTSVHPIVYGPRFVHRQLGVCEGYLPSIRREDEELAEAYSKRVKRLRRQGSGLSELRAGACHGVDYVVVAGYRDE